MVLIVILACAVADGLVHRLAFSLIRLDGRLPFISCDIFLCVCCVMCPGIIDCGIAV